MPRVVSVAVSAALSAVVVLPAQQDAAVLLRLRRLAERAPVAVAHRGCSARQPENTLAAFRAAVAAGAPVVELDVRQTRDGVWVVLHDDTLDRTTDVEAVLGRERVPVAAVDYDELQRLDAGAWRGAQFAGERVPTLAQALAMILPDAVPMIERKAGSAESLVALLREEEALDRVLVQAFDWEWLATVHALAPRLCLAALSGDPLDDTALRALPATGARIAHWDHRRLRVEDRARLHSAGLLVCVYTVDSDLALLGAAALGCDLITTNVPERLLALVADGRVLRP